MLVESHNLVKIYKSADLEVFALQGLDLRVPQGEMLALVGPSGAGKSTFLNILGALEEPSAGTCVVAGADLARLSHAEQLRYRRRIVGHIWQQTGRNLLPDLSLLENVVVPMMLASAPTRQQRSRAHELLEMVGLGPRAHHRPERLSGGEQQRGALAVALANAPALLLADEPTGELDSATASEVLALLRRLNAELGLTTIVVTHDPQVAARMDRAVAIRDGRTSTEILRSGRRPAADVGSATGREGAELLHGTGAPSALQALTAEIWAEEELVIIDSVGRLQIPRALLDDLPFDGRARLLRVGDHLELRPPRRAE